MVMRRNFPVIIISDVNLLAPGFIHSVLKTLHFIHNDHFRVASFPKCCTKYLNKI